MQNWLKKKKGGVVVMVVVYVFENLSYGEVNLLNLF